MWVFSNLAAFLINLLPDWTAPSWILSATSAIANALETVSMLGGWVPIAAVGHVVAFMMVCTGVALAVKFGRMILSLTTGGGGAT